MDEEDYKIIDWWENKLTHNERVNLNPNGWQGTKKERYNQLRSLYKQR